MAVISNTRLTILQIVNEVRQKLGIPAAASLSADAQATSMLSYLNDVISIVSDYGDWQEALNEYVTTASSSVSQYLIDVSGKIVKNIHEVAFSGTVSPLRVETLDNMRRWGRTGGTGLPNNWCIIGVDNVTTGSPYIRVYPVPGTNENNETFNVLFYEKPRIYTTSDGSVVPIFDSRLLVDGLLAMALLDESRGTQNIDFVTEFKAIFASRLQETFNRFNGDSGSDINFRIEMGR